LALKKLYEFDSIHTPQDWIEEALNVDKNGKLIHIDKNKSHRFSNRIMKTVVAAALVVVMAGAGTFTYFAGSIKDYSMTDTEKKINQQPFVLMLSGTDEDGQVVSKNSRSDANLLVAVNPNTKKISVVCTQRDAYVDIPSYTENGTEFPGGYDKLTHSSIAGMEVLKATVEKLYGVPIDYYSKVNFCGITNIVDALGGISVYSDKNFTTDADASPQEYTFTEG
jgi:LCP family protein required for cell wall assembly